mmetsp:Transcript_18692/g.32786  ORF Transcript_18692/g.32786 Transcript_18692/m.32786 type:complete len:564 (-) Transcript_18692:454-2145(-)
MPLNRLQRVRTAEDLCAALCNASKQIGHLKVEGRYHRLPTRLEDHFRITSKELGTGFNGSVFLAEEKHTGEKFAIKNLICCDLDPQKKKLLANEVELFLRIDHPKIARLWHVYEADDQVSLVMELMAGGELFDRAVEKKVFPEMEAANTTWQMLLAVRYLHHEGIAHRDLKLENFLYDAPGSAAIKLIDFGFSKLCKSGKMHEPVGTLTYTAPEVIKQKYSPGCCDLWSLGCITFILLFGYMPFDAKDDTALVKKILEGRYRVHRSAWQKVSPVAQDFVKSLLVTNPGKRMTAKVALAHPFTRTSPLANQYQPTPGLGSHAKAFFSFASASHFQRVSMQVMVYCVSGLSLETRRSFRKSFIAAQSGNNSILLFADLEKRFREELELSYEELKEVMRILRALDTDCDDEIHFSDFMAAGMTGRLWRAEGKKEENEVLLRETFRHFEVEGEGYLTAESVKAVAGEVDNLEAILAQDRWSKAGQINLEEFITYLSVVDNESFSQALESKGSDAAMCSRQRQDSALRRLHKIFFACISAPKTPSHAQSNRSLKDDASVAAHIKNAGG